jgi:hypothetical protein
MGGGWARGRPRGGRMGGGSGVDSGAVEAGAAQHEIGGGGRRRHVGPMATVPGFKSVQTESIKSNTFKFISNNFNLDSIQEGSSQAQKI